MSYIPRTGFGHLWKWYSIFFPILVGQIICLVEHSIIVSQLIIPPPSPEPMIWWTHTHTLAKNCHIELWSGARRTCKKKQTNKLARWRLIYTHIIYIYIYLNISNWSQKTLIVETQQIGPPRAATYMRPGAGLYNIWKQVRYTGTLQRLHWPLTAMFPSGSLQQ